MKDKFTYLLGAGASIQKIPTVEGFVKGLQDFHDLTLRPFKFPDSHFEVPFNTIKLSQKEVFIEYKKNLNWLMKEAFNHSSIDTFARKLYLTHNPAMLRQVKAVIDVYLTTIQLFDGIDLRYDTFFATILKGGMGQDIELPPNLKILSWNYDFQFELSASIFFRVSNSELITNKLQIHPNLAVEKYNPNHFSIFKLNGTASAYTYTDQENKFQRIKYDTLKIKDKLNDSEKHNLLTYLMACYALYTSKGTDTTSTINYAWENTHVTQSVRSQAKNETFDTKYLVVIGYSFPTFNREVDRDILQGMTNLKKVYIQTPEKDIQGVVQRFKAIRPDIEPERITATDEFFIPFEY